MHGRSSEVVLKTQIQTFKMISKGNNGLLAYKLCATVLKVAAFSLFIVSVAFSGVYQLWKLKVGQVAGLVQTKRILWETESHQHMWSCVFILKCHLSSSFCWRYHVWQDKSKTFLSQTCWFFVVQCAVCVSTITVYSSIMFQLLKVMSKDIVSIAINFHLSAR